LRRFFVLLRLLRRDLFLLLFHLAVALLLLLFRWPVITYELVLERLGS